MRIRTTSLKSVKIIEPAVFKDDRGYFFESYQKERYNSSGFDCRFVQDNVSYSVQNTLRGLHYQYPYEQTKLVQVIKGEVFDVAVDIRVGSPTFGKWEGVRLSAANHRQLFIPQGFAHGFCVLSKDAVFSYKCSDYYNPDAEGGIAWNDPNIDIRWPIVTPLLSQKDSAYPLLADVSIERLPHFQP